MDEKDEKTIDAWAGALQGEEGPCAASEDMPAKGDGRFARGFAGFSWKAFFVKAVVLIGVLYAFSLMAPFAPVPVIVLAWAAVGACAAVGLGYHVVMRKAFKQRKLTEDGRIARFVNGRSASFLICSAFSMFTTASLLIGCIDWGVVQWVLAVLSVFVFLAAYGLSGKFTADEYDPVFRNEARIGISSRVVFGVIAVLSLVSFVLVGNTGSVPISAEEALGSASNPFAQSPSALMASVGKITALAEGFKVYGISLASAGPVWAYLAVEAVLLTLTLVGMVSLLSACSLNLEEIKCVFRPLKALKDVSSAHPAKKGFVAALFALPLTFALTLAVGDGWFEEFSKTEEFRAINDSIDQRTGVAVAVVDGKYYKFDELCALQEEMQERTGALMADMQDSLVPLVNEVYDQRIRNVDAYLDWYYRPMADYELLIDFLGQLGGSAVEEVMQNKFEEIIDQNIDTSALEEAYAAHSEALDDLKNEYYERLEGLELPDDLSWVVISETQFSHDEMEAPFEVAYKESGNIGRLVGSGATGVAAGIGAKFLTEKILAKSFFSKMVSKLTGVLSRLGLMTTGGAVIGNVAGAAVALGVGILMDFAIIKIDELMNREAYRQEIIDTIEESRAEALAVLGVEQQLPEQQMGTAITGATLLAIQGS